MPTKPKAKATDEDQADAEVDQQSAEPDQEVDPDHRFSGLADPPISDPSHPDHLDWQHEHAGGPTPDELEAIHAEQEKAAEAEAEAAAQRVEAADEQDKAEQKQADKDAKADAKQSRADEQVAAVKADEEAKAAE
jgi:hypothetical protein